MHKKLPASWGQNGKKRVEMMVRNKWGQTYTKYIHIQLYNVYNVYMYTCTSHVKCMHKKLAASWQETSLNGGSQQMGSNVSNNIHEHRRAGRRGQI